MDEYASLFAAKSRWGVRVDMWRAAVAFVAIFTLMAAPSRAAPDKVLYELQERCAASAERFFTRDNPNPVLHEQGGDVVENYENHYDSRTNKCFMLQKSSKLSEGGWVNETLISINENKEYGEFTRPYGKTSIPYVCWVVETDCHSEAEWRVLISRYMEDKE